MRVRHLPTIALFVGLCSCGEETLPIAAPIGPGATITTVVESSGNWQSTGLSFEPSSDPSRADRLWVSQRRPPVEGVCEEEDPDLDYCRTLPGSVLVVQRATTTPAVHRSQDPNAWHFMRRPPGIAMGMEGRFATCGEARTGNWDDDDASFIGPTLFSSNLDEFGIQPPEKNGSHYDMLHATPFCMGIAHERNNVFWLTNGLTGTLDRYDFGEDHGPGNDDHSDGKIEHYAPGAITRVPYVPSHLAVYQPTGDVYAADTGGNRLVRLNPNYNTSASPFTPNYDGVAYHVNVHDVDVDTFGPVINQPTGLVFIANILYVASSTDSMIFALSLDGTVAGEFDTGLPTGSIGGLAVGPDHRIYLTDLLTGNVLRIEPPAATAP